MNIAAFGSKIFSVSSKKIMTFDGLTFSGELQTETQDVAGKKPSTYIKGDGLMPVSMEINLRRELGVNVGAEIEEWQKIRAAAVPQFLSIGGKPICLNRLLLKSVNVADTDFDHKGKYTQAKVTLNFEEYVRSGSAAATKEKKKKTTAKTAKKRENINAIIATADTIGRKGVVKE